MSGAGLELLEGVGGIAIAARRRRRSVRYARGETASWSRWVAHGRLLRCGLVRRQREEVEGHVPSRVESRDERECAPLKYLLDLIKGNYLHGQQFWDKPLAIGVLAGWGIFGMVVALRTFRWEPREG